MRPPLRPRVAGRAPAIAVAIGLALGASTPSHAEDLKIAELRKMSLADVLSVDISTGSSKFLSQAPAVAYVVTSEDISRLGARNLQEVLESIPGINVYMNQGIVNSPIIDLRGSFSDHGGHTMFLRDGRPIRLISQASMPEILRLPVHFIDRIEIIRGPASALYGNDAMAGAVNIVTKKDPNEAGARVGQKEDLGAWAGTHGKAGPVTWTATFNTSRDETAQETRNVLARREFTQLLDQRYDEVDLKASAGDFTVRFWALNYNKVEANNPLNPRRPTTVDTQHRQADASYALALAPTTRLQATATHTYFDGLRFAELLPGAGAVDGEDGEERTSVDVALTESRWAGHQLRVATGWSRERHFAPFVPPPPNAVTGPRRDSRDLAYASVQDEYAFAPNWELTAGARYDRYSGGNSIWSPRAGLVWTVNPQLTAKLLHNTGFRAPSLNSTGPSVTNTFERMRSTEAALDYRPTDKWRAVFNIYRYHSTNVLAFGGPAGGPVARDGTGGEAELSWLATDRLRFEAAVAMLSAHDEATSRRVPYTPRTSAKVAANWRFLDAWTWHVRMESYWDRTRLPNDTRPPLEDFRLVHTTLRFDATNRLTLLLSAHNLLNERAYVPTLFPTNAEDVRLPERNISFQVEYRF
jgi:iron complex outermembrane receptor protein